MTAHSRTGDVVTHPHPDAGAISLQGVLNAVVDPVRRSILHQLASRGADMACSSFALPVTPSTASHHFKVLLKVLREAGLIQQYYRGSSHMNVLRRRDVDNALPGLLDALLWATDHFESSVSQTAK